LARLQAAAPDDGPAWVEAFEKTALVLSLNVKCDESKPAADASDPVVVEASSPS
jgi:hypothetical protein